MGAPARRSPPPLSPRPAESAHLADDAARSAGRRPRAAPHVRAAAVPGGPTSTQSLTMTGTIVLGGPAVRGRADRAVRLQVPHTPGGVVSADRPGATTREAAPPPGESFRRCHLGSQESSAGGLCRAELARREAGWTVSR